MTSGPRLTTPVPLQMPQTMPAASLAATAGWAQGHAGHPPPSSRFPYHGFAPGYRKGHGVTTSSQATCGRTPAHASALSGLREHVYLLHYTTSSYCRTLVFMHVALKCCNLQLKWEESNYLIIFVGKLVSSFTQFYSSFLSPCKNKTVK